MCAPPVFFRISWIPLCRRFYLFVAARFCIGRNQFFRTTGLLRCHVGQVLIQRVIGVSGCCPKKQIVGVYRKHSAKCHQFWNGKTAESPFNVTDLLGTAKTDLFSQRFLCDAIFHSHFFNSFADCSKIFIFCFHHDTPYNQ